VQTFAIRAEEELVVLHQLLISGQYYHGQYTRFRVADPKPRDIHKAQVRDRVLHHAIHRVLAPYFATRFIWTSYSSRPDKGTHKAIARFEQYAWVLSRNRTRTVWVLQFDIRKFFASVDQEVLLSRLAQVFPDPLLLKLLSGVVDSFHTVPGRGHSHSSAVRRAGIPLGNLTSQLFANVYLDRVDQYAKRIIRIPCYIRYADDTLIASTNRKELSMWLGQLTIFLETELALTVHPHKTTVRAWHQGIDFLGYVSFPTHRVLRTKTRKRMLRQLTTKNQASYFGMTKHAKSWRVEKIMHDILQS
jgi:retron-type reverse transcriptase